MARGRSTIPRPSVAALVARGRSPMVAQANAGPQPVVWTPPAAETYRFQAENGDNLTAENGDYLRTE